MILPLDRVPGYGGWFRDFAAGRLPAGIDRLRRPEREADWETVRKERPPFAIPAELAATLRVEHRRAEAPAASLAAIEELARGDAVVILTGQQPGLYGGPLYTRLKIGTAVALAERLRIEWRCPVVPVYWNAADDADFDEVAHGTLPRPDLRLLRFAIPAGARVPRGWVGDLPATALAEAMAPGAGAGLGEAFDAWRDRSGAGDPDLGRLQSLEALRWYGARGLVVVDARWPELRRAAADLFRRYLSRATAVREAILASGARHGASGFDPPLGEEAASMALFLTPERIRLRLDPVEALEEARRALETHPAALSPNVALRAPVNDVVFPTVAHVAGPAEMQYLDQLVPVYEQLEVARPVVVDRALATLVPAWVREATGGGPDALEALLADPVEALHRAIAQRMPAALKTALEHSREAIAGAFDSLHDPSRGVDASLVQIIDSARDKALFQFERIPEGAYKKVRQREEAARPGLAALADFLRPRARLQERELSALGAELLGAEVALDSAVASHVDHLFEGKRGHHIVEF